MIKNSTDDGAQAIFHATCDKLAKLEDDYCEHIDHLCSLNNAANPTGTYGLGWGQKANMANQHHALPEHSHAASMYGNQLANLN